MRASGSTSSRSLLGLATASTRTRPFATSASPVPPQLAATAQHTARPARRLTTHRSTASSPPHQPLAKPSPTPNLFFTPSQYSSDVPSPHEPHPPHSPTGRVSDAEYEIRLGRAVSLLRATLEDFMRIGLVDYDSSNVTGMPSSSGLVPGLDRLGFGAILQALGASTQRRKAENDALPPHLRNQHQILPVYHPNIVFKFRPPAARTEDEGYTEPSDNPLIKFSGRTIYFASAHVLRHALSALFSETSVSMESIKLHRDKVADSSSSRPATLLVRLTFRGAVRVTQQVHDYTVIFRYRFDEDTGMVIEHKVERIEPAPGKKIWAGLSNAFARLAGLHPTPSGGGQAGTQTPSGCQHIKGTSSTGQRHHNHQLQQAEQSQPRPSPVPVPLPLNQRLVRAPNDAASRLRALQWQRRRTYATQSGPGRSRSVPQPSTVAASSFFTQPRGAEDMPGPSLASIWTPSSTTDLSAHTRSTWAPSSDDPSIITSPATPPVTKDLSTFRAIQDVTSSRQSLARIMTGLSKSNLTVLVTLTGMAGYALCPSELVALSSTASLLGGPVGTLLAFAFGTAACSASANAINQLREIPYDAQMARTRNRLLPSRTITPLQAATFATLAGTSGIATLALLNPLTAILGATNIYLYAFVYTPMKRRHIANTWVGAVVGALPPLMGWAACTGTLNLVTDAPAWCLAALLFAWQFPHFNSLSHNLSSEYARGGYRMMSVTNPALNRRTSLRYALSLLPICSIALPLSGAVSPWAYALLSMPPNCLLIAAAFQFWRQGTEKSARWCFWVSLIHLPIVMVLAMMTKKSIVDALVEYAGFGAQQEEQEAEVQQ